MRAYGIEIFLADFVSGRSRAQRLYNDGSFAVGVDVSWWNLLRRGFCMSELFDRQQAINRFHNFVSKHLRPDAKCLLLSNAGRRNVIENTQVNRDDVLKVFFRLNPQFALYRIDIWESSGDQPTFLFVKQLWTETIVGQLNCVDVSN